MPKPNFRIWMPAEITEDIIEKSAPDGTKQKVKVRKMAGLASSARKDYFDNQSLVQKGFDISYLQERGIVNWNHGKGPKDVIGEPAKVAFTEKGLWVESDLYQNARADEVWELAETLKKSGAKRKLGYSIEGKALEYDPADPTKVTKAAITNIAITINPKNADSFIDIVKGTYHGWDDAETPPPMEFAEYDGSSTSAKLVVDIVKGSTSIKVDENGEVFIKSLNTAGETSGKPLKPEHVDGGPVKGKKTDTKEEEEEANGGKAVTLTKAEVIEQLLNHPSVNSFEKAHLIYTKLNELAMNESKVTDDLLNKALGQLDSLGDNSSTDGSANTEAGATGSDANTNTTPEAAAGAAADLNKGAENTENKAETTTTQPETAGKEAGADLNKGVDAAQTQPQQYVTREDFNQLVNLVKSIGIVTKGAYDINKSVGDDLAALQDQFNSFATATPGRKSHKVAPVQREFNKSLGGEDMQERSADRKQVSVSRNRNVVLQMLDQKAFPADGGFNKAIADAMTLFEAGGTLNGQLAKSLGDEFGVDIVM